MKTLSLSAVSDDISICTKMENFLWFPVLWVISSMYRDENCGHPQSGVVGLSREGPRSLTCPRHRSPVSFSSALMTREPSDAETSKMKACSDQPGLSAAQQPTGRQAALTMPWNTSSTIACAAQRGTPASLRRRRPVRGQPVSARREVPAIDVWCRRRGTHCSTRSITPTAANYTSSSLRQL